MMLTFSDQTKEEWINSLEELKLEQAKQIAYSLSNFKSIELLPLIEAILACTGVVVFTGVGKSGFIGQKLAMTLVSCGIKSVFLSPTDALHGDIGIVSKEDLVIMLSKSGESDELMQLVPFIKNRETPLAVLACNPSSRLAQSADLLVHIPLGSEAGPYDVIPTTSTALQLIYGDILAMALVQAKGVSIDEFAKNHPAGRIGKRLTLKVKDLMLTGEKIPRASEDQCLEDVLVELSDKQCGCLLILDKEDQLIGIFTDGDLRRTLQKLRSSAFEAKLSEVMNLKPRTVESNTMAYQALEIMEENPQKPVTVLPVIEEERVVGLVKMHDLIQSGL